MDLESQLRDFLTDCKKLIVLGIGNELKSDDGVGPYIISKLKQENIENKNLLFIDSKTVPENFTGKIKKEQPTHLIIVDACLMDLNSGDMKIVNKYEFKNIGISTHSMSLSFFVRYLEKDNNFNITFVGIEPETMEMGDKLTLNVEKAANDFINILKGLVL